MDRWKRVAGALKDGSSLFLAALMGWRSSSVDKAIIMAMNHDDSKFDKKNARLVYRHVRESSLDVKPVLRAIPTRVDRTRSWPVAIKALMLTHGILRCEVPAVQRIGRLPFDLSSFGEPSRPTSRVYGLNALIRAYFSLLDESSVLVEDQWRCRRNTRVSISEELSRVQKLQSLMDSLIQIEPLAINRRTTLIIDAMECVLVEVFDIHKDICSKIARFLPLMNRYEEGFDRTIALTVVEKAISQEQHLLVFFELCREFELPSAHHVIQQYAKIPTEDLQTLKKHINEDPYGNNHAKKTIPPRILDASFDNSNRNDTTSELSRFTPAIFKLFGTVPNL